MAVGQNQWYNFGAVPFWGSAPPILEPMLVGHWDVHWGYGVLTHGHINVKQTVFGLLFGQSTRWETRFGPSSFTKASARHKIAVSLSQPKGGSQKKNISISRTKKSPPLWHWGAEKKTFWGQKMVNQVEYHVFVVYCRSLTMFVGVALVPFWWFVEHVQCLG